MLRTTLSIARSASKVRPTNPVLDRPPHDPHRSPVHPQSMVVESRSSWCVIAVHHPQPRRRAEQEPKAQSGRQNRRILEACSTRRPTALGVNSNLRCSPIAKVQDQVQEQGNLPRPQRRRAIPPPASRARHQPLAPELEPAPGCSPISRPCLVASSTPLHRPLPFIDRGSASPYSPSSTFRTGTRPPRSERSCRLVSHRPRSRCWPRRLHQRRGYCRRR